MAQPTTQAAGSITKHSPLNRPVTLGVIVGNRGFFPHHLAAEGRETILRVLEGAGIRAIIPDSAATDHGAIESLEESRLCADVFRTHRDEIDGILVTLPNFGDERAIANTIRFAELNVPVLVHAFPDDPTRMGIDSRRDSFCGKMSACNNLRQYNIPYSLTSQHTMDPTGTAFQTDLKNFAAVCRVVRGMRRARVGAIGARPTNFNTVRYSEKLLEQSGISVETLDLSEVFGRIDRLEPDDAAVTAKRQSIERYANARGVPESAVIKMSKLGVVIDQWTAAGQLDATAIQCWTSMEEYFGVVPCTIMSMASDSLTPSACETDVAGVVGMLALVLASGKPSALVDWNNNYGDDPDKGVVFHSLISPRRSSWMRSFAWIIRRSSRARLGARIPTARWLAACEEIRSPTCASQPMIWPGKSPPTWGRASSPTIPWTPLAAMGWSAFRGSRICSPTSVKMVMSTMSR